MIIIELSSVPHSFLIVSPIINQSTFISQTASNRPDNASRISTELTRLHHEDLLQLVPQLATSVADFRRDEDTLLVLLVEVPFIRGPEGKSGSIVISFLLSLRERRSFGRRLPFGHIRA